MDLLTVLPLYCTCTACISRLCVHFWRRWKKENMQSWSRSFHLCSISFVWCGATLSTTDSLLVSWYYSRRSPTSLLNWYNYILFLSLCAFSFSLSPSLPSSLSLLFLSLTQTQRFSSFNNSPTVSELCVRRDSSQWARRGSGETAAGLPGVQQVPGELRGSEGSPKGLLQEGDTRCGVGVWTKFGVCSSGPLHSSAQTDWGVSYSTYPQYTYVCMCVFDTIIMELGLSIEQTEGGAISFIVWSHASDGWVYIVCDEIHVHACTVHVLHVYIHVVHVHCTCIYNVHTWSVTINAIYVIMCI